VPAATVAASIALAAAAGPIDVAPLQIEVRARALRPGEPVRIDVIAPVRAESLAGEFLGRSVFLVRGAEREAGDAWSGWSVIDLDRPPGPVPVQVRGRAVDGRPLHGTGTVTIEAWDFPEERLAVAPQYVEPPAEVQERLARERATLAGVYGTRRSVAPADRPFAAPVAGEATSPFGTRRTFNGEPRDPHSGLDLRAPAGTPVHAAGPGIVTLARDLYYSGRTVIVDHGGGLFTVYAHLSEMRVREGDAAATGDLLGLSGASGRVTGPHLHWGAKVGDVAFDPTALLDPSLWDASTTPASTR
jgi:murein DD-endopeptidase MepM/ murein hydrolase activator NlpD